MDERIGRTRELALALLSSMGVCVGWHSSEEDPKSELGLALLSSMGVVCVGWH